MAAGMQQRKSRALMAEIQHHNQKGVLDVAGRVGECSSRLNLIRIKRKDLIFFHQIVFLGWHFREGLQIFRLSCMELKFTSNLME